MMISPQTFIEELEDKSYEELLKVRDELIVDILYFEKHFEEQMQDELRICPSPDLVYQFNLEYLSELCKLISEKFDETVDIPEEVKDKYNNPRFVCNYKEYQVFCEDYGEDCPAIGMPEFLLYKDGSVRYASEEEIHEIFKMLPDD